MITATILEIVILCNTNVPPISTYSYVYSTDGWLDRLARFGNKSCEYDYLGNPRIYKDNSLKWNGRQLTKFGNHTFDYDANGIRFKKNTITYSLDGDKILKETDGTNTITYYYGVNGIVGLNYNGVDYYYRKNLQGDVVEIYTASGTLAASYIYDAWGNHLVLSAYGAGNTSSTFIGNVNPIRYRGYYFDRETGLYYLQTRYYDPEVGRFISPDSLDYLDPETLGGINLYSYCNNNPVMYADPSGHLPKWTAWLVSGAVIVGGIVLCATGVGGIFGGVLIGAGAGSLINGYVTEANGGDFTAGYIGGVISGALCGVGAGLGGLALVAASKVANLACIGYLALGFTTSFAGGFVGNLAGTVYTSLHNSGFKSVDVDWGETLLTSAIMGVLNFFAGMGSGVSSIVGAMGGAATNINSQLALRLLAGLIAGGTEGAYDLISYLLGKLISYF